MMQLETFILMISLLIWWADAAVSSGEETCAGDASCLSPISGQALLQRTRLGRKSVGVENIMDQDPEVQLSYIQELAAQHVQGQNQTTLELYLKMLNETIHDSGFAKLDSEHQLGVHLMAGHASALGQCSSKLSNSVLDAETRAFATLDAAVTSCTAEVSSLEGQKATAKDSLREFISALNETWKSISPVPADSETTFSETYLQSVGAWLAQNEEFLDLYSSNNFQTKHSTFANLSSQHSASSEACSNETTKLGDTACEIADLVEVMTGEFETCWANMSGLLNMTMDEQKMQCSLRIKDYQAFKKIVCFASVLATNDISQASDKLTKCQSTNYSVTSLQFEAPMVPERPTQQIQDLINSVPSGFMCPGKTTTAAASTTATMPQSEVPNPFQDEQVKLDQWSSTNKGSYIELSDNNLTAASTYELGHSWNSVYSVGTQPSAAASWTVKVTNLSDHAHNYFEMVLGVSMGTGYPDSFYPYEADSYAYIQENGRERSGNPPYYGEYAAGYALGDEIKVEMVNDVLSFYKNGEDQGAAYNVTPGDYHLVAGLGDSGDAVAIVG